MMPQTGKSLLRGYCYQTLTTFLSQKKRQRNIYWHSYNLPVPGIFESYVRLRHLLGWLRCQLLLLHKACPAADPLLL